MGIAPSKSEGETAAGRRRGGGRSGFLDCDGCESGRLEFTGRGAPVGRFDLPVGAGTGAIACGVAEAGHNLIGFLGDAEHFSDGGNSIEHLEPSILSEGFHSEGDGFLFDSGGGCTCHDEGFDFVPDGEDFENTEPSFEAGLAALFAARVGVDTGRGALFGREAQFEGGGVIDGDGTPAVEAEAADEPLGDDPLE